MKLRFGLAVVGALLLAACGSSSVSAISATVTGNDGDGGPVTNDPDGGKPGTLDDGGPGCGSDCSTPHPVEPCTGMTCSHPPPASCVDATTRRTYAASGICTAGACSYATTDVACATAILGADAVCASGACDFKCRSGYTRSGGSCVQSAGWTTESTGTMLSFEGIWGSGPGDIYSPGPRKRGWISCEDLEQSALMADPAQEPFALLWNLRP